MVECWGQACFQVGKNQPLKKVCDNGSKSNWAEVIEGHCTRGQPICVFQSRCRYRLLQIK